MSVVHTCVMDIVAVPVAGGPGPSSGDRELLDVAKADGEETSREQAEMPVFMDEDDDEEEGSEYREESPPPSEPIVRKPNSRGCKVEFKAGRSLTHEFDDSNLWAHDPNETAKHMIESYKRECMLLKIRPISKLLEQLERLDDLNTPIDTLDLKGIRLDHRSCEVLEAVLSRMQMTTLDLERTNLDDEGAIALCEMIEFYGCATRLIFASNNRLRPRAWLNIGRTLKKSPFITMMNANYCNLEEQTLTLLLRSVRANCCLKVLKLVGNNLTGKGTFILMAAMKFNENLQELYLGSNHLTTEDGQHLGSILRTNHTLRVMDLRENTLGDAGVRFICAGIAEQQEGLHVLNLTSNNIGQEGFHHISAMLPCTRSLRDLNASHNRCGDNGLFMLKLGLLANRSLEKVNLSCIKMTCEGAIALAEVLAESKHLIELDLKENDIRVAGLMALQLAHRMNRSLTCMETPKSYRVEQRDRPLIKSLLAEIDKYCARNLQEREERNEAERRRQHEAQHAKLLVTSAEEEQGVLTAGGNPLDKAAEDEEEKEVDPSLVGSLDDVYQDEPGAEMREEDPFAKVPVKDDHQNLMEMERSVDAMAQLAEHEEDPESPLSLDSPGLNASADVSSLDSGVRNMNLSPAAKQLPDLVGVTPPSHPQQASNQVAQANLPLDLAVGAQRSVDLIEGVSSSSTTANSQPVDLTEGLERPHHGNS